ncbi:hypothetical protein AJ79_04383 [Helicocarpus griseus UAMH5409]|uniref:Alcohol dehydrogenase-like C-terminal domain-containing protein n=1 Tax=Helicocarpus griseus UAMH5409 TaxID=1447875 RepID=A0A2B7XV09_9EURO|nr:hypothetical protein AJ79_04383 [Helicocarpus griseus UAMH5409]
MCHLSRRHRSCVREVLNLNLDYGVPVGVIGVGGQGSLGIQFTRTLGHPTVTIDNRPEGLQLAGEVPLSLSPQEIVGYNDPYVVSQILNFAGDGGLAAVVVCTDNVEMTGWSLKLLRSKGVCTILGLPTDELRFNASDLVFKESSIIGSIVANPRLVFDMM